LSTHPPGQQTANAAVFKPNPNNETSITSPMYRMYRPYFFRKNSVVRQVEQSNFVHR
jgi:hypothetical protein